jgi:hypothetical protein
LTDIDIINVYSHHCFSRIIKFEKVIFIHIWYLIIINL